MIDNIADYLDMVEEQGWRTRRTTSGYQFFPPKGPVVTLLARGCGTATGDHRVVMNWRAQLRRAGLQIPDDQRKAKREKTVSTNGMNGKPAPSAPAVGPTPPPSPAELGELFALAEKRLDALVNECAALQSVLGQIRQRAEKNERIRELLRELQT